ncbi:het-domain-containing [Trichoderma arundinaceum]|uniref:Het-domain-containing n=1 Tax=Trichoderma arundinaceum TaxID=490622 RepID=A0A395NQ12_TRIAR|nr:het-domain-containing [Trichoderma arundinaceum]
MADYTYSALSGLANIRIIELFPAPNEASILKCNIRILNLEDDSCQYEALSYTWGEAIFSRTLQVEADDGSDGTIGITPSAADAMQHLRYHDRTRNLWIDAICINQKDEKEKSTQIPLMRGIYRRASRVVISLGGSDQGVRDLSTLRDFVLDENSQNPVAIAACQSAVESLERISDLPWFSRRWIIQEAVLNPEVVIFCGSSSMAWPKFLAHVARLRSKMKRGDTVAKRLLIMLEIWYKTALTQSESTFRLKDDLITFEDSQCTDPRDHIFALTGLDKTVKLIEPGGLSSEELDRTADSSEPDESDSSCTDSSDETGSSVSKPKRWFMGDVVLRADYTMSTEEVFTEFATAAIQSGYFFWVLWQAAVRKKRGEASLPSWVPDWRNSMDNRITNTPLPGLCLSLARMKIGGLPKYHEFRITHVFPPFPEGDIRLIDVEDWLMDVWKDHKRRPLKQKAKINDFCRILYAELHDWGLLSDIMIGKYDDFDEVDDVLVYIQQRMKGRTLFTFQSGAIECIGIVARNWGFQTGNCSFPLALSP